jgi:hypothetical protein
MKFIYCHSVYRFLSSPLLSKNTKIESLYVKLVVKIVLIIKQDSIMKSDYITVMVYMSKYPSMMNIRNVRIRFQALTTSHNLAAIQ